MTNRLTHKTISIVIILTMLLSILPFSSAAATETSEPIIVIAGSDFQADTPQDGAANVKSIISAMKQDGYNNLYGFLFGGDYNTDYNAMDEEIAVLKDAVKSEYSDLDDSNMVFVQGNHDPADSVGLSPSGANDSEHYGVFVIHEDDYMWYNDDEATVKNTADNLKAYLKEKSDNGYKKPVFIASHLSLAYSKRTYNDGDGMYAQYLFDVLNEYGDKLNIIFMYGHNHNNVYDDYLGGTTVYLTKGDEIFISQLGNKTATPNKYTLNFTYLNYGYVSSPYCLNNAISMTVFEINDETVSVKRYSAGGQIALKTKGAWASSLSETAEFYGTTDDYLNTEYSGTDYIGNGIYKNGVEVINPNLTQLTVDLSSTNPQPDFYSAYTGYDIATAGYATGESALVKIKIPDSFDLSKPVFIKSSKTGDTSAFFDQDGKLIIKTLALGSFEIYQTNGTEIARSNIAIYKPVTQFVDGKNTIIATKNTAGQAFALKSNSDGSLSYGEIQIQNGYDGVYIPDTDNSLKWLFTHDEDFGYAAVIGDLKNLSTDRYLSAANGDDLQTVTDTEADYTAWRVASNEFGVYTLKDKNTYDRYYLKFSEGFYSSLDTVATERVYLFTEETISLGTYIYCSDTNVTVLDNITENEPIGIKICIASDEGALETVDVTLSMIKNSDGSSVSPQIGIYENLKLYYDGKLICDNIVLSVEKDTSLDKDKIPLDNLIRGSDYSISVTNEPVAEPEWGTSYKADLTDGIAADEFSSSNDSWFLYSAYKNVENGIGTFTVDLGKVCDITKLRLHLSNAGAGMGVYAPTKIEAFALIDGEYTSIGNFGINNEDTVIYWTALSVEDVQTDSIKIEITLNGFFAYVNEIEVHGTETSIDEPDYLKGDANDDGKYTAADYLMVKKIVFGTLDIADLPNQETAMLRCDCNGDGKITATDYFLTKRLILS